MKFIDNRDTRNNFTELGTPMMGFKYERSNASENDEELFGIHTNKGFTIAVEEDELFRMIEIIKKTKECRKK